MPCSHYNIKSAFFHLVKIFTLAFIPVPSIFVSDVAAEIPAKAGLTQAGTANAQCLMPWLGFDRPILKSRSGEDLLLSGRLAETHSIERLEN